jgi:hypothetical protein
MKFAMRSEVFRDMNISEKQQRELTRVAEEKLRKKSALLSYAAYKRTRKVRVRTKANQASRKSAQICPALSKSLPISSGMTHAKTNTNLYT